MAMPIELLLQVLLGDLREVGLERSLPGDLHGESIDPALVGDRAELLDRGAGSRLFCRGTVIRVACRFDDAGLGLVLQLLAM